jgi:exonuclease III
LRSYLANKPVDILSINETRLDDSIDNAGVHIQGYNLYRKDRCGGGVAIYARDVLNVKNRSQLIPTLIEAVCVEVIKPKTKPFFITSIYRPPNSKVDFMDNLENYLNELDKQNKELIITGDLNCDLSILDLQSHSHRLMVSFSCFN